MPPNDVLCFGAMQSTYHPIFHRPVYPAHLAPIGVSCCMEAVFGVPFQPQGAPPGLPHDRVSLQGESALPVGGQEDCHIAPSGLAVAEPVDAVVWGVMVTCKGGGGEDEGGRRNCGKGQG